jgi:hypothetical protein
MDATETKESDSVAKYKTKEILREGSLLKSKQVTPVEVLLLQNTIELCRETKYVFLDRV